MPGTPRCNASLASVYSTCASGSANFNSSSLSDVLLNVNNYTDGGVAVDGVDQFLCDMENAEFGAIPGASGLLWCGCFGAACTNARR